MMSKESRLPLLILALGLGSAIVLLGNAATDIILRKPLISDGAFGSVDAPDVAILHVIFTSLPLFVLALKGSRSGVLWGVAVALAVLFWTYFVYQIWRDSLTGFEGGANIGLGLIMMVSPVVSLVVLAVVAAAIRRT